MIPPKTAEERATKIHDGVCECTYYIGRDRHIEYIAAQITEACEESVEEKNKEWLEKFHVIGTQNAVNAHEQGRTEGFAEGIERAADCLIFKPGEDKLTFDPVCIKELKEQPEVAMRKLLAGFADEIRALKGPEK